MKRKEKGMRKDKETGCRDERRRRRKRRRRRPSTVGLATALTHKHSVVGTLMSQCTPHPQIAFACPPCGAAQVAEMMTTPKHVTRSPVGGAQHVTRSRAGGAQPVGALPAGHVVTTCSLLHHSPALGAPHPACKLEPIMSRSTSIPAGETLGVA